MDRKISVSLKFRDSNNHPYFEYEIYQYHVHHENDVKSGTVRIYYSLEKDQFEIIPLHISQIEPVIYKDMTYNPNLYKVPFFVINESHFNCIIFHVLKSWILTTDDDNTFPFFLGQQKIFNCPMALENTDHSPFISRLNIGTLNSEYEPFHILKDRVKKIHDQTMHEPVTKILSGKIPVPNEIINLIVDNAFPLARY